MAFTPTRILAATALAGTLALTACSSDGPPASAPTGYDLVESGTLTPGEAVPAPTSEVVLTVRGAIDATNHGEDLAFDLATLESVGLVEYTVDDPQAEGHVVTFRGVLLADVLAVAGAKEVTNLHTIALNDYAVDIPGEDLELPVLLATSVDGERMPVDRYGPVRVVYPTHAFDLDPTTYDPRWIWQLATIEVS